MTNDTVASVLAHVAQRRPGAPAIVGPDASTATHGELDREVRRFVAWLRSHDVAPADRIVKTDEIKCLVPSGNIPAGTLLRRSMFVEPKKG